MEWVSFRKNLFFSEQSHCRTWKEVRNPTCGGSFGRLCMRGKDFLKCLDLLSGLMLRWGFGLGEKIPCRKPWNHVKGEERDEAVCFGGRLKIVSHCSQRERLSGRSGWEDYLSDPGKVFGPDQEAADRIKAWGMVNGMRFLAREVGATALHGVDAKILWAECRGWSLWIPSNA